MTLDQRYKDTKGWTASHLVQDAIANFGGDWQVSEQQEERFKAAELKDSADSFAVRGARPMPIGRALTQKDCMDCNVPTFERVRVARQYVKKGSPFTTKALCVNCQTRATERRDEIERDQWAELTASDKVAEFDRYDR